MTQNDHELSDSQIDLIRNLPIVLDMSSSLYHRWYFELRLQEEIFRCKRHDRPLALLAVRLGSPPDAEGQYELDDLLSQIVTEALRATDMASQLEANEYAIFLLETDKAGAELVATRISDVLSPFEPTVGIALYPRDADHAEALIEKARKPKAGPVVDFGDFKRQRGA